jgi:uncharacterized membrane protein (DUF373 family)
MLKKNWSYPNPKTTDKKEHRIQRFWEIIPGFLTWFTLIGMFFFSYIIPVWVAIFVIIFDAYWIWRTVYISSYSVMAYKKMKRWSSINWRHRLEAIFDNDKLLEELEQEIVSLKDDLFQKKFSKKERKILKNNLLERRNFLKRAKSDLKNRKEFIDWKNIYHVMMLPNAIETADNIRPALQAIVDANYPKNKIIILLAMEEREPKEKREEKIRLLSEEFEDKFFGFVTTVHRVEGNEMKCKASNTTYAAKKMKKFLEEKNIPLENVVLSNLDCESRIHPQYLAALTYAYVTEPKRLQCAYQPLPVYNNNLWDTIAPVRVIVTGSSFWQMVESMRPEHMVTFSSHSESFKTIVDINYWPVNVISEDSLVYWNAYNYFDGDYRVKPIYLPISMDAVLGNTYWHTIKNQYKQNHRWAYGIENLPLLFRAFRKNKKIPLLTKIKHLFNMLEGHYSWATTSFILAILGWLPLILGDEKFNESVLAHNLPFITRYLMTLAMVGLVVSMFLSLMTLPPKPKKYKKRKYLAMVFQWGMAPFIAPFLGALPAVHAQTRIMLGKYMGEFWVTEKIVKKSKKSVE